MFASSHEFEKRPIRTVISASTWKITERPMSAEKAYQGHTAHEEKAVSFSANSRKPTR